MTSATEELDQEVVPSTFDLGSTDDWVRKLRRVRARILAEPVVLRMGEWLVREGELPFAFPECGVVGCIAGWVLLDSKLDAGWKPDELVRFDSHTVGEDAAKILGLTDAQAYRLFYHSSWPSEFLSRLNRTEPQTPEYARVVADRIEHFILTGGAR